MEFITLNTQLIVGSSQLRTGAIEIDSNLLSIQIIGVGIDNPDVIVKVFGGHDTNTNNYGELLKPNDVTPISYDVSNGYYLYTIDTAYQKYICFELDSVAATVGTVGILISYKKGIFNSPKFFNYLTTIHNDLTGLNDGDYKHLTAAEYAAFAASTPHNHSNKPILDLIEEALTTALKTAYDSAVTWISTNGTNLINHLSDNLNPHNVTASQVGAYTTTQTDDLLDEKQDILISVKDHDYYWSAGSISGFGITDNLDGSISVDAGIILLRNAATEISPITKLNVLADANITLTDNSTNYIYVDYNGGIPNILSTTSINGFNCLDKCIIYVVARYGTNLEILSVGNQSVDSNRKQRIKLFERGGFERTRGLIIGNSGLKINVSDGDVWYGLEKHNISAFDTNISDTFTYFYDSGGWVRTINQTDIDDINLASGVMTNNHYKVEYVYVIANTPDKLYINLSDIEYNKLSDAYLDMPPNTLPPELDGLGILIGRLIILKSGGVVEINSAFDTKFVFTGVTNHEDLANLQGGTLGEHYHLTQTEHEDLTLYFDEGFNFIDVETAYYKRNENFKINTIENPDALTVTIEVNGSSYTLTDPINAYDEVTIDVDAVGFIVLNCESI